MMQQRRLPYAAVLTLYTAVPLEACRVVMIDQCWTVSCTQHAARAPRDQIESKLQHPAKSPEQTSAMLDSAIGSVHHCSWFKSPG